MAKSPNIFDLLSIVQSGDIGRAARTLGLTPEALRKRLESVESVLGINIVGTAAKALKPGEAGRLVIDHASRIFSQARDLTRDLEELAGLQAPEILFGTDIFAAELPLGVALGRMVSVNTRLRVEVVLANFEDLTAQVLANKLEFAIADTASAERHPARLAIEPIAEHRVFFFVRHDHPLTVAENVTLDGILEFPLVSPRVPQRMAVHLSKSMPNARVDRETGDLSPNLMLDSFSVAKAAVIAGDGIGIAPLTAIESELRQGKLAVVAFDAPWMHTSYGLFYPRKTSLSRAAQLFVTQLRQVETALQERELRAVARRQVKRRGGGASKTGARRRKTPAARARGPRSPRKR
jgi:DNA-binding transcriptional LysR family regulator